jgi:hypothetical protein
MSLQNLYIHIGGEKTGTKSIQRYMAVNWKEFLRDDGILYAKQSPYYGSFSGNHSPFSSVFLPPEELNFVPPAQRLSKYDLEHEMLRLLTTPHAETLVLSSEHLSSRFRARSIEELFNFIRKFSQFKEIRLIYYVRDQLGLALSAFSTEVANGRRQWLNLRNISQDDPYYNYYITARAWSDVFGKENIDIIQYKQIEDSILSFVDAIGIKSHKKKHNFPPKLNRRMSVEEINMTIKLNKIFPTWEECFDNQSKYFSSRKFISTVRKIHNIVNNKSSDIYTYIDADSATEFSQKFTNSNNKLKQYFNLSFDL